MDRYCKAAIKTFGFLLCIAVPTLLVDLAPADTGPGSALRTAGGLLLDLALISWGGYLARSYLRSR